MNLGSLALLNGLVFCLACGLTRFLWSSASPLSLMDIPNARSLHETPTPRTGGLAVIGSVMVGGLAAPLLGLTAEGQGDTFLWILGAALLIGGVSFLDDRMGLSPGLRMGIQTAVTGAVVWSTGLTLEVLSVPLLGTLSLGHAAIPVTILLLVWMTNLYNFMDGMDGLCGGMTVFGFCFLGLAAWGADSFVLIAWLIAASAAGFLVHNFPPAKIFMGDVGSVPIGFLAGVLAVMGNHNGQFDIWVPVLIFSPFIVDATVTLLRRLFRGEKVWMAHREHYYQRLALAGWGHKKTVLAEYILMLASGASALLYGRLGDGGRLALLLAWMLIYVALAFGVRRIE